MSKKHQSGWESYDPHGGAGRPKYSWSWGQGRSYESGLDKWGGSYWAWEPSEPYTDGSRVVVHDGYDVERAKSAEDSYTQFGQVIRSLRSEMPSVDALADDVYWSFLHRAVDTTGNAPLRGPYKHHKPLLEALLSTDQYAAIHDATIGESFLAARAARVSLAGLVAALSEATRERLQAMGGLQENIDMLTARADAFEMLGEFRPSDKERFDQEAARARAQAADLQARLDKLDRQGIPQSELDAARAIAEQALKGEQPQIQSIKDGLSALGQQKANGYSPTGAGHISRTMSEDEKRKLVEKILKSRRIQEVSKIAGRMKMIAQRVQQRKAELVSEEITSIDIGQDIGRMLPEELALLSGDPTLATAWALAFAEEMLVQYEVHGKEDVGRGPIIIAVDNSGSMSGRPDVWAKAVMLALLEIARTQRRDALLLQFDTRIARESYYPKGQGSPEQIATDLEFFTGGGTYFDPWMTRALEKVKESQWEKADVIAITDGLCSVDDRVRDDWNKQRAERGMRAYCILITSVWGGSWGQDEMKQLTDYMVSISDVQKEMSEDSGVLNTLFSV